MNSWRVHCANIFAAPHANRAAEKHPCSVRAFSQPHTNGVLATRARGRHHFTRRRASTESLHFSTVAPSSRESHSSRGNTRQAPSVQEEKPRESNSRPPFGVVSFASAPANSKAGLLNRSDLSSRDAS